MLIFGLHGLHLLGGGVFFEWRNEWFTDIPSLCHHRWLRCSCKAPKNEARQQMAHGPIGQGWSLEFQVWPSPIISLCLQLIFLSFPPWYCQTWREVNNAGEGPGRPQLVKTSEFTPFDLPSEWGVNIKWYQVSTWSYMIHGSDWARCLFMLKWISHDITQCEISQTCPVQPRCWRNRWQKTSSGNWTKQNQLFSEITWKYCF
jgi:hypothetical protein